MMLIKEILSAVAIVLTFIAFLPYIRSIHQGKTKPHVFSWVIWASTTFIVAMAQLADGAGPGAWPIAVSGLITIYVALLAYLKRGDITITAVDWGFFVVAMSAIPVWYLTADPLWAVVILTTIDLLGMGPTFRKAYAAPYQEQVTFYLIFAVRNLIAIAALYHYSITTVLFPAVIALGCLLLVVMILVRRRVLNPV